MSILSVMESCFTMESRFSLRYCIKTFCDANIGASMIDFDAENKPIFASFVAREENSVVVMSHSSSFVRATIESKFSSSLIVNEIMFELVLAGIVVRTSIFLLPAFLPCLAVLSQHG